MTPIEEADIRAHIECRDNSTMADLTARQVRLILADRDKLLRQLAETKAELEHTIASHGKEIAELKAYREGGVTEEILRRNDGYIKLGRGCVIVRDDEWAALNERVKELVKFYDDQVGTPCEQIRHTEEVKALTERLATAEAEIVEWKAKAVESDIELQRKNEALTQRLTEMERKYHELLYAVGNKYENESRHETALRYIREREQPKTNEPAKQALEGEGK